MRMRRYNTPLALGSAVQYLLIANLLIYALQVLVQLQAFGPARSPLGLLNLRGLTWLERAFALTPYDVLHKGYIWQLVSHMFLHGGMWHIAFNMLALWMFGSGVERVWGMRRFFAYYFFTGIGAGVLTVAIAWFSDPAANCALFFTAQCVPSIGASGAVYGVLLAFGLLFPNQIIYLYFFPIRAKYAVVVLGALAFVSGLGGLNQGINHFAHLGGILFGLVYLKGRGWWVWLTGRSRWR